MNQTHEIGIKTKKNERAAETPQASHVNILVDRTRKCVVVCAIPIVDHHHYHHYHQYHDRDQLWCKIIKYFPIVLQVDRSSKGNKFVIFLLTSQLFAI